MCTCRAYICYDAKPNAQLGHSETLQTIELPIGSGRMSHNASPMRQLSKEYFLNVQAARYAQSPC